MPDLAELLKDPVVADWVLGAVMRDTRVRVRINGLGLPPRMQEVVEALAAASDAAATPAIGSASGTVVGTVSPREGSWATVKEMALRFGISEGYARRLARGGAVISQKRGRDYLIDPDSMQTVLGRTHDDHHRRGSDGDRREAG